MIQCDKFIENGKIRPPITFKSGLNTILGDEFASNSIGKSTFLMILDFVFGGDDYVRRSIDVQINIGPHTINFVFEFEDGLHYFSRATDDSNCINVCDENYQSLRVISKNDYTSFLSKKFNLDLPGLTLRNAISRFFRVYGRETLDPKYPLQSATKESQSVGIDGLLKLFDRYEAVKKQKEMTKQAELEEKMFKGAQKFNYLPSVNNKEQYKKNEKRITELEKEIQHLIRENEGGLVELETIQTESLSELRKQLKVAKREYTRLTNELDSIEIDRIKRHTWKADYEQLQQFFPEINMKKLEKIEHFHKTLTTLFKHEFKEKSTSLQSMIELVAQQIVQLEMKITELGNVPNVAHAILTKHCQKQKELDLLQAANNSYDTQERLKHRRSQLEDQLNALILAVTAYTETDINAMMHELNNIINGKRTAPHLTIKGAGRYTFSIPNDRGTGSQYKSLIIFDLVALIMTNLPVLAHDSVLLKQIEDRALEKILQLYNETERQIFIVLDKKGSFTEKAQKILQETAILNLYPKGGELFGHAWNNMN
jgi:hypothetical protein